MAATRRPLLTQDPAPLTAFGAARRAGAVEVCFTPGGQRLGDDGDRWRSLLFGAPPARA